MSGPRCGDCPRVGSHRFGALRFHLILWSEAGVPGVPSVVGSWSTCNGCKCHSVVFSCTGIFFESIMSWQKCLRS